MAQEGESLKEMAARRWRAHREAFRVGADSGTLCIADTTNGRSLSYYVVEGATDPDLFRAFRGELAMDDAPSDLASLSLAVLSQRVPRIPVPLSEALRDLGVMDGVPGLVVRSVKAFVDGFADPRVAALLPEAQLRASETRRVMAAGLDGVVAAFSPSAIAAISKVPAFERRHYEFYAAEGETGHIRCQAAAQYPMLAALMAERPSLRRAIDEKSPLAEPVQAAFGNKADGTPRVGKAVVSRLRAIPWGTNGVSLDRLVTSLGAIPADWVPKDETEWNVFCDVVETVGKILPGVTGQPLDALIANCGGKWAVYAERLAVSHTDTRPPEGTTARSRTDFETVIPWDSIKALPKDKVLAAATESVSRLSDPPPDCEPGGDVPSGCLPVGVDRQSMVDWIVRVVAPDSTRDGLRAACVAVEEMVDALGRKVLLPLAALRSGASDVFLSRIHAEEATRAAADILFSGKTAANMFEQARHFRSQMRRVLAGGNPELDPMAQAEEAANQEKALSETRVRVARELAMLGVDEVIPHDGWLPLFHPVQAPNGVWLVPLTNPRLLADEGRGFGGTNPVNPDGSRGLLLCVGTDPSYAVNCKTRGHQIISLREVSEEGEFKRLSTVELEPQGPGGLLRVRQHMAKGNSTPGEKSQRAWEWLANAIASGALPTNAEAIRSRMGEEKRRSESDDVGDICGYKWREARCVAHAAKMWERYLPKRYRGNVDALAEDAGVARLIELIEPRVASPASRIR